MIFNPNEAINLVWRFRVIDPVTEQASLVNPGAVSFEVSDPHGTSTTYVFGVDGNVSNPSVGVFVCLLDAPHVEGAYLYRVIGSGGVEAESGWQEFEVGEDAIEPSKAVSGGPCQQWINGDDLVRVYGDDLGIAAAEGFLAEKAAEIGSTLMYVLSARQYPGICETTVRPCRDGCSCFGQSVAAGTAGLFGWGGTLGGSYGFIGPWWVNECGDRCGCGVLPSVRLAGFPVVEVVEVKIAGVVVDPATYRLDQHRDLVALAGATWPHCQRLDLPDTEPATWSVRYRYGLEVDELGRQAALQIAAEIWKALNRKKDCALPAGVTRIVRQGVTVEKVTSFAAIFAAGVSGLPIVDMFLAQANPTGARRPPAVYSPDLPEYPREIG